MDPRLWSLPDGLEWCDGVKELYNRPCYDRITADVLTRTHALVIGTPGVGKSQYVQVLLVELVKRARENRTELPTIHYVYEATPGKVVFLSLKADGSAVELISSSDDSDAPDYLLSDGVEKAPELRPNICIA